MAEPAPTASLPTPAAAAQSDDPWWRRWARKIVGPPRNRVELLQQINAARRVGLIEIDAADMVRGVFETDELQVRDIMIPRAQMVVMEHDWTLSQVQREATDSGHSRFPVVSDSRDEILGILMAKELIDLGSDTNNADPQAAFDFERYVRPAVFVPESKRVNVLLKEFRVSRNHMAVVVDEYGGVAGLVTIEDLLEQIVGDIDDEYDVASGAAILRLEDNRFQVQGLTPVIEFNRYFDAEFSDEEFDTIGGRVTHAFGHVPKRGETLVIGHFQFNIQSADSRRIHQIQVTVLPEAET